MKESVQQHIQRFYSKDKNHQGTSFKQLMKITGQPVDWAYQIWDDLLDLLKNGDNRGRSIAAQLLCNLAKSDPDDRMLKDLPKLFKATKDERFWKDVLK